MLCSHIISLFCSRFSLFDGSHVTFFSVHLLGTCLCCVHFLMYAASSCVSTCVAGMVLMIALNVYTASCDTMGDLNVIFAHTSLAGKLFAFIW